MEKDPKMEEMIKLLEKDLCKGIIKIQFKILKKIVASLKEHRGYKKNKNNENIQCLSDEHGKPHNA